MVCETTGPGAVCVIASACNEPPPTPTPAEATLPPPPPDPDYASRGRYGSSPASPPPPPEQHEPRQPGWLEYLADSIFGGDGCLYGDIAGRDRWGNFVCY